MLLRGDFQASKLLAAGLPNLYELLEASAEAVGGIDFYPQIKRPFRGHGAFSDIFEGL